MPATPKTGKVYRFDDLEFYAYAGAIKIHDNRDGTTRTVNPVDFLEHATALYAEIPRQVYYDEKLRFQRMAQNVEACCKEAAEMGNPFDPGVQAFKARHARMERPAVVQGGFVSEKGVLVPSGLIT